MIFRYPWLLLALALVPLLVYLRYGRRGRASMRFSDGSLLAGVAPSWAILAQPLMPLRYGIALALIVICLARPQKGLEESDLSAEGIDIVLGMDVSTSMLAEDFSSGGQPINRINASKQVLEQFIESRTHDRMGLVAFAAMPYTMAPLSMDRAWLLQQVQRLETGVLPDGTGIGSGLAAAINRLRDSDAKSKIVVLLTDGVNNAGEITPLNAAKSAEALGIKVYTIGAGTDGLVRIPMRDPFGGTQYVRQPSEIDEPTLMEMAKITGGKFYRARDLDTLRQVYEEIDQLEKTEIKINQYRYFEEKFQPFLALALGLLGLENLLSVSRLGRLP